MIDEIRLKDFLDVLARERDPRIVLLLQAVASPSSTYHHDALRGVLNILEDNYPEEVAEILSEYKPLEDDSGPNKNIDDYHQSGQSHEIGEFGDENLYGTDYLPFANYAMSHESIQEYHLHLFLQNPEAINSLLILIAQDKDLDPALLALLDDPGYELEKLNAAPESDLSDLDEDFSPSPRPGSSYYSDDSES